MDESSGRWVTIKLSPRLEELSHCSGLTHVLFQDSESPDPAPSLSLLLRWSLLGPAPLHHHQLPRLAPVSQE